MDESASLVDHLTELRKRIIWILIVLAITMVGGFFVAKLTIFYLLNMEPAASLTLPLNTFSPWDAIRLYMQFAFAAGLCISIPFTLYQFWLFVKPGLTETENKATLRYIPFAFLLFLTGMAFGYFVVFPMAFQFTLLVTRSLGLTDMYGVAQYFSFMFNIIIPMSLLFEMPVVVMFLTKIRVLNPLLLRKVRKFAYVVLVFVATFITPPDLISDILVSILLIILYEISVWLSFRIYRKQLERKQGLEEVQDDAVPAV